VSPLVLGARVIPGTRRGRHRRVELPDGRRGWIECIALAAGSRARIGLIERVRGLLGVPYLWGGRTPVGMDCSAFTQLVLAEQGIAVSRDAAQQERGARRLTDGEEAEMGDLVFFGRPGGPAGHVGLVLGGGYFAHARGQVRINSLDFRNRLCDNVLISQLRGIRRPRTST
jgi:cell wall-associated NlpC family hydrolase